MFLAFSGAVRAGTSRACAEMGVSCFDQESKSSFCKLYLAGYETLKVLRWQGLQHGYEGFPRKSGHLHLSLTGDARNPICTTEV